jgi:hypothetical protein
MRTRIVLFCIIVLAFCLWLLLHHTNQQARADSNETQTSVNQKSATLPTQTQSAEVARDQQSVTSNTIRHSITATNDLEQGLINEWQAPIEFYGKVVDENTNPVEAANVQFQWSESPTQDVAKTFITKSDVNGLFSFQGARGRSLDVYVSKEGYYNSKRDKTGYMYALADDIFSPSISNPVIFHLRKKGKGESLIHIGGIGLHTMRDYLLDANGKPTDVSLFTGQLTPTGRGDLQVEFQAGPPLDNLSSRITRQCQVSVPEGGLIQTSDEFPFLAPEDGYQTSDAWSITATNWTETVNQQYYVKLRNGDFGRVNIRVIGASRPFLRLDSYVNPSGSQDLEPTQ